MGALHEGHLALVRAAKSENDTAVVSIFVNPLQFGPKEDLKKYPRPIARDRALLRKAGVHYLFYPAPDKMYGENFATVVDVGAGLRPRKKGAAPFPLTSVLCGKSRPGHFRGVSTVVTKLFHLAKPHRVYFGSKDYQQAAVISRLVGDLDMDLEVRVLPTVREKDGLAMSSRNRYLSGEQRRRAVVIPETLLWIHRQFALGRRDLAAVKKTALRRLKAAVNRVDYLEIVDPVTLRPLDKVRESMQALTACFIGKTRLIDNVRMTFRRAVE
jgi:pantoate--beta-alanine ligase